MRNKQTEMRDWCADMLQLSLSQNNPYQNYARYHGNALTIPVDPKWSTNTDVPDAKISARLAERGYEVDDLGRPIHPWYRLILEKAGLVAGRGKYYSWGPNFTADPVVIASTKEPKILLVQRSDNKRWALPGGFIDEGESAIKASVREAQEETGIILPPEPELVIYEGVVADERTTAHAWPYTVASLWIIDKCSQVKPSEESLDVDWFSLDRLPGELHGSHQKIIEFAIESLKP